MIRPDQIPEDVWHTAMSTYHKAIRKRPGTAWQEAIAAALNAWPQMHLHEWQRPWLGGMSGTDIILPMPQEAGDE